MFFHFLSSINVFVLRKILSLMCVLSFPPHRNCKNVKIVNFYENIIYLSYIIRVPEFKKTFDDKFFIIVTLLCARKLLLHILCRALPSFRLWLLIVHFLCVYVFFLCVNYTYSYINLYIDKFS